MGGGKESIVGLSFSDNPIGSQIHVITDDNSSVNSTTLKSETVCVSHHCVLGIRNTRVE